AAARQVADLVPGLRPGRRARRRRRVGAMSAATAKNAAVNAAAASTWRRFLIRLFLAVAIIFLFALLARAGGPQRIAGTSYFAATVTGQPLVWPQGTITYYTDQGDRSQQRWPAGRRCKRHQRLCEFRGHHHYACRHSAVGYRYARGCRLRRRRFGDRGLAGRWCWRLQPVLH